MSLFQIHNDKFMLRAFSFGAGVQSTAIMLLLKHEPETLRAVMGHLPDVALFADTGAEPMETHRHLERLQAAGLPLPLEVVRNGSILTGPAKGEDDEEEGVSSRSFAPYFIKNEDGTTGMLMRKCTNEFKIRPIERALRRHLGAVPRQRLPLHAVGLWLGISTDEVVRMRQNPTRWCDNLYPLIELGWDRRRCLDYCREHGVNPPKSRCFFCPYISDWPQFRREAPEDYARAIAFDEEIRKPHAGLRATAYIHRLCLPLPEAVDAQEEDERRRIAGQIPLFPELMTNGFLNECQGHCGV